MKMNKKILIPLFLVMMFALVNAAADNVIEFYETGDDDFIDVKGNQWIAQTFTIGASGTNQTAVNITSVGLRAFDAGIDTTVVTISIRRVIQEGGEAGKPTGTDLIHNITTIGAFPASADWVNFTFNSTFNINNSAMYALIMTTANNNEVVNWRHDQTSPTYSGGTYVASSDGTTWDAPSSTFDQMFQLFGPAVAPTATGLDVTLNFPISDHLISSTIVTFNSTLTPRLAEDMNLTNATVFVWNSTGGLFNTTTNFTISGDEANNSIITLPNFGLGSFSWNVLGCGVNKTVSTNTTCLFATTNETFEVGASINSQFYRNSTWDTDNSTFAINISLIPGATLFAGSLVYNGTSHEAAITNLGSNNYQLTRTIDIPAIEANNTKNFFWRFTFNNAAFRQQNSSTATHEVTSTIFNETGIAGQEAINYTIFDEVTLEDISAEFDGTFDWYLGSGTETKNESYETTTTAHQYTFFNTPGNRTFRTDSVIRINPVSTPSNNFTYRPRLFDFNLDLLNSTVLHRQLYLINQSLATNVQIEVVDQGLSPLENIFVTIKRFYPGENVFRVVESRETDAFGKFTAQLVERDVKYTFEFRNEANQLLKKEEDVIITCPSTFCTLEFVIQDTSVDINRFGNRTGEGYTLEFNNNTNIFTMTWNDNTNVNPTYRLEVERILFNGTTTICNTNTTAAFGSLTCSVGDSRASYRGQAFVTVADSERRLEVLNIKVGTDFRAFGLEGMMWSFVLLFTLIAIGSFHPVLAIVLYLVGLIVLGLTQIIYINPAIIIAQLVIGGLFIWAFRS